MLEIFVDFIDRSVSVKVVSFEVLSQVAQIARDLCVFRIYYCNRGQV